MEHAAGANGHPEPRAAVAATSGHLQQEQVQQQQRAQRVQQLYELYDRVDLHSQEHEELMFRAELPLLLDDIVTLQQTEEDIKAAIALCGPHHQAGRSSSAAAHMSHCNGDAELVRQAAQQTAASRAALDAEQAESFLGLQAALAACIAQRSEVMAVAAEVATEAAASGYQMTSPGGALPEQHGDTASSSAAVDWGSVHRSVLEQGKLRWTAPDVEAVAAALGQFLEDTGLNRHLSIQHQQHAAPHEQHAAGGEGITGGGAAAAGKGGPVAAPMRSSLLQIKLPTQAKELQLALFAPIESLGAAESSTPAASEL